MKRNKKYDVSNLIKQRLVKVYVENNKQIFEYTGEDNIVSVTEKEYKLHFRGHMDITKIENIEKLFDIMDINLKDALVSYNNDYDPRVGIVKAITAFNKLQEVINKEIGIIAKLQEDVNKEIDALVDNKIIDKNDF